MNYRLSALALGATLLVGCASSSTDDRPQGRSDPLEGFNRTMSRFLYEDDLNKVIEAVKEWSR